MIVFISWIKAARARGFFDGPKLSAHVQNEIDLGAVPDLRDFDEATRRPEDRLAAGRLARRGVYDAQV